MAGTFRSARLIDARVPIGEQRETVGVDEHLEAALLVPTPRRACLTSARLVLELGRGGLTDGKQLHRA